MATLKSPIFWDRTLGSLIDFRRCFEWAYFSYPDISSPTFRSEVLLCFTYCLLAACSGYSSCRELEAVCYFKWWINFCQTTLRHVPGDNSCSSLVYAFPFKPVLLHISFKSCVTFSYINLLTVYRPRTDICCFSLLTHGSHIVLSPASTHVPFSDIRNTNSVLYLIWKLTALRDRLTPTDPM